MMGNTANNMNGRSIGLGSGNSNSMGNMGNTGSGYGYGVSMNTDNASGLRKGECFLLCLRFY